MEKREKKGDVCANRDMIYFFTCRAFRDEDGIVGLGYGSGVRVRR